MAAVRIVTVRDSARRPFRTTVFVDGVAVEEQPSTARTVVRDRNKLADLYSRGDYDSVTAAPIPYMIERTKNR